MSQSVLRAVQCGRPHSLASSRSMLVLFIPNKESHNFNLNFIEFLLCCKKNELKIPAASTKTLSFHHQNENQRLSSVSVRRTAPQKYGQIEEKKSKLTTQNRSKCQTQPYEQQASQPCRRKIIQWGHDDCVFPSFSFFLFFFLFARFPFFPIHAKYRIYGWLYYFLSFVFCLFVLNTIPSQKKRWAQKTQPKSPVAQYTYAWMNRWTWNGDEAVRAGRPSHMKCHLSRRNVCKNFNRISRIQFYFCLSRLSPMPWPGLLPLLYRCVCVFARSPAVPPMAFPSIPHPFSTASRVPRPPSLAQCVFCFSTILFSFGEVCCFFSLVWA